MESLLLTLSFFIHLILLIGIYYLFKEMNKIKNEHANADEIAALLEAYLLEIKVENERLENKKTQQKPIVSAETPVNKEPIKPRTEAHSMPTGDKLKDYTPLAPTIEDEVETTLQAQILQLASQGLSSDAIAEQLNCGKTEVALILKFHSPDK